MTVIRQFGAIVIVVFLISGQIIRLSNGNEKPHPRNTKIALERIYEARSPDYCEKSKKCIRTRKYMIRLYNKKRWPTLHAASAVLKQWKKSDPFTHAESPVWDPETQTLYWVDVLNNEVHSLDYKTKERKVKRIENGHGEVNVVIPVANSTALLICSQATIFLMNWDRPDLMTIAQVEPQKPRNVINEAKCDARGRIWAGTKGPQKGDQVKRNWAGLYKLEPPCYKPVQVLNDVTISNGMVWSLNNTILYYIDSIYNKIEAFNYDLDKGLISNRRTVVNLAEWGFSDVVPDGMTIDRDGFLWVALFFNGSIIRIDPDQRTIVEQYKLPVSRVTSLAWGGPALEDLIVTTSRRNLRPRMLAARPLSGTIIVLHSLGTGGVAAHKCHYRNNSITDCLVQS